MGPWAVRLRGYDLSRSVAAGCGPFGIAGAMNSGGSFAAVGVEMAAVQVGDAEGQV